jgi:hypothetical protein
MITINYQLGPTARRVVAKATGALALPPAPPLSESTNFIPQVGDAMRWASISNDVIFVVETRLFNISGDGQVVVDLYVETTGKDTA